MSDFVPEEKERLERQEFIDRTKSSRERNRLGQFATPPFLARGIVREALRLRDATDPIRFGEPSIGSGAFFSALLAEAPQERIASAEGFEKVVKFSMNQTGRRTVAGRPI